MTRHRTDPQPFTAATCPCGTAVATVEVAGTRVLIDADDDPDGEIHGLRMGSRWVFTTATTTAVTGQTMNRRRHRCPHTTQSDLRRQISDTEGPCRMYCGRRVPHAYGPDAEPFCPSCAAAHQPEPETVDPNQPTG